MGPKRKRAIPKPADLPLALSKSIEVMKKRPVLLAEWRKAIKSKDLDQSFDSCVIFAQYEGGSGVCISEEGLVLTCAHCLGDRPRVGCKKLLVFSNGLVCYAVAERVNERADTAILRISGTFSETGEYNDEARLYPYSSLALDPLIPAAPLVCVGQPGRDDLESKRPRKTQYSILKSSRGSFVGVLEGDLHDNTEIGKLIHDCWTYWGHSGAPLFSHQGRIVGLHSSWDDEAETRHGVHMEALTAIVFV